MILETIKLTGCAFENHIINGSANLNYNWEQFCTLSEERKKDFIWFALVELKLNTDYGFNKIDESTYKEYFDLIQVKKTGVTRYGNDSELSINGTILKSAAQGITLLAYGDSSTGEGAKIPFRSLHYSCECQDYKDFIACINIIESYNNFDANLIRRKAFFALNIQKFYSESNPNNGSNVFRYIIGRESSPVFYIKYNPYYKTNIIKDRDGAMVYWEEYTAEDFKENMQKLSKAIKADEFTIEEKEFFGKTHYEARFWFD